MSNPEKPDRHLQSAESQKQQAAASRETNRPTDSVPVVSGQFANLPATFGRYQVERLLGRGAMGAVYLARDTQLDRLVALKIPKVTASGSKKLLVRLETEAKAAAKLDHPSLCKVYDAGEINGQCFIAMQYIEGETLKTQLDVKSKTVAEAVSLIMQLAEGLSEAHALGIIHRDLKPENIMVNRRGLPVVMDFGLAKFSTISSNAKATQAGTILGSPAYMSPEQASGNVQEIDQRSDLYALGIILFEMLTGELPFNGSAMQILGQKSILEAASPLSLKPDLPPRLAAICHKMIAKNSADRYQTLAEVGTDLKGVDLSLAPPVIDTPSVGESPFSNFMVSAPPVERTANTAKRQLMVRAQSARDSSRALKTRFQQLVTSWNRQSQFVRWTSLGGAAFLILCGVIIITIKSKDGKQFKIEVPDSSTVRISTDSRKRTKVARAQIPQVPVLTPPDSPPMPILPTDNLTKDSSDKSEFPVGADIDLLPMVTFPDHAVLGKWKKNNGAIFGEGTPQQRFLVPIVVGGSYELKCKFTRHTGYGDLSLIIPVGETSCSLSCLNEAFGLNQVYGRSVRELVHTPAAVQRTAPLENGMAYELHVTVLLDDQNVTIQSSLNGDRLISWEGKVSQLTCAGSHSLANFRSIGIHSFDSDLTIHTLELRLNRGGRGFSLGDDWQNPLNTVVDAPTSDIVTKCVDSNGRKYFFSDNPMSLPDAQQLAGRLKGRLLMISTSDEEQFIAKHCKGLDIWTAAWRPPEVMVWRDERNRPLRYFGKWNVTSNKENDEDRTELQLLFSPSRCRKGSLQGNYHTCIEWGEEYP